jgi:hypothetical protein
VINAGKMLLKFASVVSPEAEAAADALQAFVATVNALMTQEESNTLEYA